MTERGRAGCDDWRERESAAVVLAVILSAETLAAGILDAMSLVAV